MGQGPTWPEISGLSERFISMVVENSIRQYCPENCTVVLKAMPDPRSQSSQPGLCKCPESGLVTKGQDPQALGPMEEREAVMVNIN